MTTPYNDPTLGRPGGAGGTGQSPAGPAAAAADGSWVSREEHETALEEEKRRRSGDERRHQKEKSQLERRMEALEQRLVQQGQGSGQGSGAGQAPRQSYTPPANLPALPASDPAAAWINHIVENVSGWQNSILQERAEAQSSREMQAALEEARRRGVPEDAIDDDSPEAVRNSTREYLRQKEIDDLKAQVADLSGGRDTAYAQGRAQSGATAVSTSTGRAPQRGLTIDDDIAAVDAEIAAARRQSGTDAMVALQESSRAREMLLEAKRAGRQNSFRS